MPSAIVVGASTGIGLAISHRLVAAGWSVTGFARRPSPLTTAGYRHVIADVADPGYRSLLEAAVEVTPELCIYAAGIGHELALPDLTREAGVFVTNLVGAVITAEVIVPRMLAAGAGHLIGLSSQADRVIHADAPSYGASKAGLSSYLESLALACRPHGVAITNLRFGFVDTAMSSASGPRPFLITADRAAAVIVRCMRKRPIRHTSPKRMAAVLWFLRWGARVRIWAS